RLFIEGIAVDSFFESIYAEFRDLSARAGTRLQFEIIEWESLVVAADKIALRDLYRMALAGIINSAGGGSVILRAFSYLDDACVMFEILVDPHTPHTATAETPWVSNLDGLRQVVQRMGGEINILACPTAGVGFHFWLPQWIGAADEWLAA